jgi:alpha-L-rhamnosidase
MQAGFAQWFYEYAGGIKPVEDYPAFEFFHIKPFGYNQLKFSKTSFESVNGAILSDWRMQDGKFEIDLEIPVNSKAMLYLPADLDSRVIIKQKKKGSDTFEILEYSDGFIPVLLESGAYYLVSEF